MSKSRVESSRPTTGQNTVDTLQYGFSTGKNLTRRERENRPENESIIRGCKVTRDVFEELTAKHGDMSRYVQAGRNHRGVLNGTI